MKGIILVIFDYVKKSQSTVKKFNYRFVILRLLRFLCHRGAIVFFLGIFLHPQRSGYSPAMNLNFKSKYRIPRSFTNKWTKNGELRQSQ